MIRIVLACAGLAAEIALIYQSQWLAAAITGAGVVLVIALIPVVAEFRDLWGTALERLRKVPEPEPAPPPVPVSASTGDGYVCIRCGGPGETTWDDATVRAARHAGVCGRCFRGAVVQLAECRSSDEDPTMQVAAGNGGPGAAGRHRAKRKALDSLTDAVKAAARVPLP